MGVFIVLFCGFGRLNLNCLRVKTPHVVVRSSAERLTLVTSRQSRVVAAVEAAINALFSSSFTTNQAVYSIKVAFLVSI